MIIFLKNTISEKSPICSMTLTKQHKSKFDTVTVINNVLIIKYQNKQEIKFVIQSLTKSILLSIN